VTDACSSKANTSFVHEPPQGVFQRPSVVLGISKPLVYFLKGLTTTSNPPKSVKGYRCPKENTILKSTEVDLMLIPPSRLNNNEKTTEADLTLLLPQGWADRADARPVQPTLTYVFEAYEVLRRTEVRPNPILSQSDASREIPEGNSQAACI
jgi:hypothetical protein